MGYGGSRGGQVDARRGSTGGRGWMDIGDGKAAAATGGEAVCGEVRAER
jgi:hypothetical protein